MGRVKVLEAGFGVPFGRGGMEVIVWGWYENFDHGKIAVDFMCETLSDEKYMKRLADNNSKFFHVKKSRNRILRFFENISFIGKTIKENNYDAVHIHATNAFGAFRYYIAAKPYCDRIFIHSHSTGIGMENEKMDFSGKIRLILHKICRHLMNGRNVIRLSCSKAAAEWMFPKKNKYTLIRNGIKTSDFVFDENIRSRIRRELGLENKFVIGHIGRFSYAKNHDFLIDVFEEVYKKNPDSVLLLIGSGTLEKHIKEKVKKAGLYNNVIFYGAANNANELYQAMDCFVFPSRFEGMPVVLIEAQASSLKCICSDSITKEVKITDMSEYISLNETPGKWAEKILSCNRSYKRPNMTEEIIKSGCDIRESAKQLEELYLGFEKKK